MADAVLIVMMLAVVLYAVLGGADFGVGMIEPFLGPSARERVNAALSPVWEANHIWLILVVVLAFVAFPEPFALVSVDLHIPWLMVLLGVVARGSAFTFRHYDPEPGALDAWYTWTFRLGSLLTPLFLGVIAAASLEGRLPLHLTSNFYDSFVEPWNTPLAWTTGVFTCSLFAFEGAALLAAELGTSVGEPLPYLRLARRLHIVTIVTGGAVLWWVTQSRSVALTEILHSPLSITSQIAAGLLVPVVAWAFQNGRHWLLRLATGAQLSCVLVGFWGGAYPVLLRHREGAFSVADAAPAATLRPLLIAVGLGLAMIAPALTYLLHVYKLRGPEEN